MAEKTSSNTELTAPTLAKLQDINAVYGLGCSDERLKEYQEIIQESVKDFNFVSNFQLPRYISELPVDRSYKHVSGDDNKYNAWYVKCQIQGRKEGKLAGKQIAIKDNIPVADLPMMNGSAVIEGYTSSDDATVVQRILAEGGIIVGKTTCEDMCLSGASFHTRKGPVKNPVNPGHTSGGSSSGSAVVVATGEVDMAIGGDQGGSIRIPASNCGIVGLKPTHSLVPYTGAVPIVPCVDHLGPMAKTVKDCALLLEVIAGYDDGRDYRQRPTVVPEYTKEIYPQKKIEKKIKIGILKEGVQVCDIKVQNVFNKAVEVLQANQNLVIQQTAAPFHETAGKAFNVFIFMGTFGSMIDGCGFGMGVSGYQSPELTEKIFTGYKQHSSKLSDTMKIPLLLCDYVKEKYGPHHFAKSSTILHHARQEYDRLLDEYDVLMMPTLPSTACKLPDDKTSLKDRIKMAFDMIPNTGPFDYTGHPAISFNCGYSDGLPVGLMLVGKHFDETTVLNVASIMEEILCK